MHLILFLLKLFQIILKLEICQNQFATTVTTKDDFKTKLKDIRVTYLNRIITSHININEFKLLPETEIDKSFPTNLFIVPCFTSLYRFDRNKDEGEILVYIWQDIPSKLLNILYIASDIQCLGIEVNL